jgi:hypothetical protein
MCPQCKTSQSSDVNTCTNCGYQFVFSSSAFGITDEQMLYIVKSVQSKNPKLYYTQNQWLHFLQEEKKELKQPESLLLLPLVLIFIVVGLMPLQYGVVIGVFLGILTLVAKLEYYAPASHKKLKDITQRWLDAGKDIDHLLWQPMLEHQPQHYQPLNTQVNCVILTEQDLYVDLLVKNELHLKYNALVLSQNLYPHHVHPLLEQLLVKQPQVPIYVLHNSHTDMHKVVSQLQPIQQKIGIQSLQLKDVDVNIDYFDNDAALNKVKKTLPSPNTHLPLDVLPLHYLDQLLEQATFTQNSHLITLTAPKPITPAQSTVYRVVKKVGGTPKEVKKILNQLQKTYWKAQQMVENIQVDYQEFKANIQQKGVTYTSKIDPKIWSKGIDKQLHSIRLLQQEMHSLKGVIIHTSDTLRSLDLDLLPDRLNEVDELKQKLDNLQTLHARHLNEIMQDDIANLLEYAKLKPSWDGYQKQVQKFLVVRRTLASLEAKYLPYRTQVDEQAATLWKIFEPALAPLTKDKEIKAQIRTLTIDYGAQIKDLAKNKEACAPIEPQYKACIAQLTKLAGQIKTWQKDYATDQMMDAKNKELWLNYEGYEEEGFWEAYNDLLFLVKDPMMEVTLASQWLEKQPWKPLYDILGL